MVSVWCSEPSWSLLAPWGAPMPPANSHLEKRERERERERETETGTTTEERETERERESDLLEDPLMGEEAQVSSRSDQMSRWETHPSDMAAGDAPS